MNNYTARSMRTTLQSFRWPVLLVLSMFGISMAEAAVQMNTFVPLNQEVWIDCDGDGLLEDVVQLEGDLHIVLKETVDKAGGLHTSYSYQPVNVSGIGYLTGDTYRAVGLTRQGGTIKGDNFTETFVNNYYIIGQASGIKFMVHEVFHLTVVNGELVVVVDHYEVRCE